MAALWTRINTLLLLLLVLMAGATIAILATRAESGPLDPPGAPGSSLPQVEPRNPIPAPGWNGTFPITINAPGSYFLTQNITGVNGVDGILIASRDVSLDLNGFLLDGNGADLADGIEVAGFSSENVEIHNGSLKDWTGYGIRMVDGTGSMRVSDVRISDSGVGVIAGGGSLIEDCTIRDSTSVGISITQGVVRRCNVFSNADIGIIAAGGTLIEDNLVSFNGFGTSTNRSNVWVVNLYNYVRDNVVVSSPDGTTSFRITGSNNHLLRNYYRCGTVVDGGGNFFPAAIDLVDTNYC